MSKNKPALIPLSSTKRFNRKSSLQKNLFLSYDDDSEQIDNDFISSNDSFKNVSLSTLNSLYDTGSQNHLLIKYAKTNDGQGHGSSAGDDMQKKREIYSLFLFVFFLFVTIITLSQILVMHNQSHSSNFGQIKLMQEELKLMDATIDTMLKENRVLPMQVWYAMKQYNDNLKRFTGFIDDVSFSSQTNTNNNTDIIYSPEQRLAHLKQCEDFTNKKLNLLLHTENNKENNKIESKPLKLIYKVLADSLKAAEGPSSIDALSTEINVALKISLKKINILQSQLNDTVSLQMQKDCLNSMTHGLFSLFSQQYTKFFEREPKLRDLLVDRYTLINNTLAKFNSHNYVLKMPLRNMNELYAKYKQNQRQFNTNSSQLCDPQPPNLKGPINVFDNHSLTFHDVELENEHVEMGGRWSPKKCQARHKLAIIIPYRDRQEHLITLLSYLHPLLQRQQLDYKIYVTEQAGNGTFNKAIIMNAAFIYAFDQNNYNCYCFHDVDLVPEDDRNMYSCGSSPKHMSIGVDEMNYKLQYEELIGGVLILNTEHLIASNGYSNLYWGWGAEDDDLYYRLKGLSYKVERPPLKIGRYKMMKHKKRKPQLWSKRVKLLYSSVNRMTWDGISSANYTIIKVTENKLYTHLLIDVGSPPAGFD